MGSSRIPEQPHVVVIGGGTGSFVLLSALKNFTPHITALVNMADDGGSTGQLRDEFGVLPPGDVRQCLVALSDSPKLRDLFNYRFDGGGLDGHAFGNLFLAAIEKMTGSFAEGVALASEVLAIKGAVEPMTLTNSRLVMRDQSGNESKGQYHLTQEGEIGDGRKNEFRLEPEADANPAALAAIEAADVVVIAPGNLYGSLAPALIVPGVGAALKRSKAWKCYVSNLVTKPGQTDGFSVSDFASEIERFAGEKFLDAVLFNTEEPSKDLLEKYAADGELAVRCDKEVAAHYALIGTPLLSGTICPSTSASDPISHQRTLIRHDATSVAKAIFAAYEDFVTNH